MREEEPEHMHTLVDDEPTLSLNQTAQVLDCTRRWVYHLLDAQELDSRKVGQNRVVTVASITAHIERLRERADDIERQTRAEGAQRADGLRVRATATTDRLRAHVEQAGAAA